jgi:hypothetical protein
MAHTLTRPCTHMHTQTNKLYLLLFHDNSDTRTRLSVTLYVHCSLTFYLKPSRPTKISVFNCVRKSSTAVWKFFCFDVIKMWLFFFLNDIFGSKPTCSAFRCNSLFDYLWSRTAWLRSKFNCNYCSFVSG